MSQALHYAPAPALPNARSHVTLILCTILHTMTHMFQMLLVPLYLLIQADLGLADVRQASLLVTVYGIVYFIVSYPAGVLADRIDRKNLLGIGLLVNGLAFVGLGLTRDYHTMIALAVIAGLAGSMFHPAANALVPEHYPKSPGMAIGLLGIGSGLGFFFGPQFAGWRAQTAHWHLWNVSAWQRPCIEAGAGAAVFALLFMWIAREARHRPTHAGRTHVKLDARLRGVMIVVASILSLRDFAGVAGLSLVSIYLQKAFGLSVGRTGWIVGALALPGVIGNPVGVYLSSGPRRLPTLAIVLLFSCLFVCFVPFCGLWAGIALLAGFYLMQFASYAISDAAILERVPAPLRGRVVGLFLTIAGTFSALGPFTMGWGADHLGARASEPRAYWPLFITLGVMIGAASTVIIFIKRLGERTGPAVDPLREIDVEAARPIA